MKPLKKQISYEKDKDVLALVRLFVGYDIENYLDQHVTFPLLNVFADNLHEVIYDWMWSDLYEASF